MIGKITERSIRYKFDKSKYPSFNNPDGYLSREKCAKLTKLFIVVGVTAVFDQEFVQPKINLSSFGFFCICSQNARFMHVQTHS